jgi:sulfate adenylyltransferase
LAVVEVVEVFEADRKEEAAAVFGTTDPKHPGVKRLEGLPPFYAAGPLLEYHPEELDLPMACLTPAQTRTIFAERGWKTTAGFQTRNPIHRAHEHLLRLAMERLDGVLIHPLVGATRVEDVPAPVRVRCYEALVENYLPRERVVLTGMPGAMRYAGPKEAIFHAVIRRNHGCTHFIVGRDHAGVGGFYKKFAAQELLASLPRGELGIEPLFFPEAFWCHRCGGMVTSRTCAHPDAERLTFSGTFIRGQIRSGGEIPPQCSRPEVIEILRREWGPRPAAGR